MATILVLRIQAKPYVGGTEDRPAKNWRHYLLALIGLALGLSSPSSTGAEHSEPLVFATTN